MKTVVSNQDTGLVQGIVSGPDKKPAENARVYAYKWLGGKEFDAEPIEETDASGKYTDYGAYRGPADFKSPKTLADGKFRLTLPKGTYCLVARKRRNQEVEQGPITPEDFSSTVSEPVTIEPGKTVDTSAKLIDTLRDENFFNLYTIRSFRTGFSGKILSQRNKPVSGVIVTADKSSKIRRKPDFISAPTDEEGKYTVYLFSGGHYKLGIKKKKPGPYLNFQQQNDSENKTLSIPQGKIVPDVDLVLEENVPAPL